MAVNKKDVAAGLASAVALISGAQVASAADVECRHPLMIGAAYISVFLPACSGAMLLCPKITIII